MRKGKSDFEWWWVILAFAWMFPTVLNMLNPTPIPSACTEWANVTCNSWDAWECNINVTTKVTTGPFYDEKTEYVTIYERNVCIEWANGTRVSP
jgi:hypothetical protein